MRDFIGPGDRHLKGKSSAPLIGLCVSLSQFHHRQSQSHKKATWGWLEWHKMAFVLLKLLKRGCYSKINNLFTSSPSYNPHNL